MAINFIQILQCNLVSIQNALLLIGILVKLDAGTILAPAKSQSIWKPYNTQCSYIYIHLVNSFLVLNINSVGSVIIMLRQWHLCLYLSKYLETCVLMSILNCHI